MITEKMDLDRELDNFRQKSNRSVQLLREAGVVVDTTEWLTIKRYAERYGVSTQVVTNWINRGVIPADCVMELPELNNLRLVKNQAYR